MAATLTLTDLHIMDSQPRVMDLRLAESLQFQDKHKIRDLIKRNQSELESHGDLISATAAEIKLDNGTNPKGAGRKGFEYHLNEPQALLICMFSRTEKAALVRKMLVDLYMQWRLGQLPEAPRQQEPEPLLPDGALRDLEEVRIKLAMVAQSRKLFGNERARCLWSLLNLPEPPQAYNVGENEPYEALQLVLWANLGRETVHTLLSRAFITGAEPLGLAKIGVRAFPAREAFAICATHPAMQAIVSGSRYGHNLSRTLARLPGAISTSIWVEGRNLRGILLPSRYLDEQPDGFDKA
jgi:hypothetical protein